MAKQEIKELDTKVLQTGVVNALKITERVTKAALLELLGNPETTDSKTYVELSFIRPITLLGHRYLDKIAYNVEDGHFTCKLVGRGLSSLDSCIYLAPYMSKIMEAEFTLATVTYELS